jgi:hypothetical protein
MIAPLAKLMDWSAVQAATLMMRFLSVFENRPGYSALLPDVSVTDLLSSG